MFTVVIADDEPRICELIRHLIHWEELGLSLLDCVHDGQDLYHAIVQRRPDIVITDVVMPRMTGLEIIQTVGREDISCNFIIISGHRYFDYVQEAMKNGACDYLLKPINGDELNETLQKICAKMTDRLHDSNMLSSKRQEIEQTRQILKRHLIMNAFLSKSEPFDQIERLNQEYSVAFSEGACQAAILIVEGNHDAMVDMICLKAIAAIEDRLREAGAYTVSSAMGGQAFFLLNYRAPGGDTEREIDVAFADVLHLAGMFSGVSVTLGCSREEARFSRFPQAIQAAQLAVRNRIILGRNRVIWPQQENGRPPEAPADREQLQQLAHILDGLNEEKYEEWLRELCSERAGTWSGNDWYELCEKIGEVFHRVLYNESIRDSSAPLSAELVASLERAPRESLLQALIGPVSQRLNALRAEKQEQNSKPIRQAKEYIDAHYMEPIRLEDVAGHVYLHPAYLSHIFKETLGVGFSDYVANCRLERAKYLLTHTNDTIYGVARQVGYTEARAFSKFFQKNVGVKPSDYRKMYA